MRRLVSLVAVLLFLGPVRAASAGGSWLEPTDAPRVRIGEWDLAYASAGGLVSMRGTFSTGQQAAVSEGPWYAYLRPDAKSAEPGVEPALLGRVDISGTGYPYVATVTFKVPSVAAGYYWVDVCDLGCKQGVGDLIGGNLVLAPTEGEARLFARAFILQSIHKADIRVLDTLRRRGDVLEAEAVQARKAARSAEARVDEATDRAAEATGQAADAQAAMEDASRQRDLWRLIGVLALLASLLAAAWAVSLRRRMRALTSDDPAGLKPLTGDALPKAAAKKGP